MAVALRDGAVYEDGNEFRCSLHKLVFFKLHPCATLTQCLAQYTRNTKRSINETCAIMTAKGQTYQRTNTPGMERRVLMPKKGQVGGSHGTFARNSTDLGGGGEFDDTVVGKCMQLAHRVCAVRTSEGDSDSEIKRLVVD